MLVREWSGHPSCPSQARFHRPAALVAVCLMLTVGASASARSPNAMLWPTAVCRSSAIALTPDGRTLLAVNPDSNTLSVMDTAQNTLLAELTVGVEPRAVAVSPDGSWAAVACQGADQVVAIQLGQLAVRHTVSVGDRPVGAAFSPDGERLAVAEMGDDRVSWVDTETWEVQSVTSVGDRPYGLAFTPDGCRLLVTHLLSGEVTVIPVLGERIYLPLILRGLSLPAGGRSGAQAAPTSDNPPLPRISTWLNVAPAPAVAVNAAGTRAYLPQTMAHGLGLNTQFDTSVFPKVSVLNLATWTHQTSEHISLPETDQPVGLPWDAALTQDGQELWVVNAASNDVSVVDIATPNRPLRVAHLTVGDNPRGIALHPDGTRAYVNNTLAGTVSVIDTLAYTVTGQIATTRIPLPPVLLRGKQLYFSSAETELAQARWIACNTCHIEGEHDGRTWLLQYTGQVPVGAQAVITRNTTSLLGMVETYPLRWSAEWDESADSEHSVRFEQFGTGLIDGDMHATLGAPNQGRSWDLDCLASYIDSLAVPEREHSLTEAERRGRALFESWQTMCLCCHPPPLYTDLKAHDVGTASAYGEWFGPLMDTPTLRFLYDSAPYLHDGSASTLYDLLTTENRDDPHGVGWLLTEEEINDLVAFLLALPYSADEESFTYQSSGCLGPPDRAVDEVEIWVEGSDIVMAHHDAVYNCCCHVVVYWEDHRPLIKLIEREDYPDSGPCRCMCKHEVSARLSNLPVGTYTVEVWNGVTEERLASAVVEVG